MVIFHSYVSHYQRVAQWMGVFFPQRSGHRRCFRRARHAAVELPIHLQIVEGFSTVPGLVNLQKAT